MSVYLDDGDVRLLHGDVLAELATLPAESVQCVVTSPPYWGLRDYGTASWTGGDEACDHLGPPKPTQAGFNERYFGRESKGSDKEADLRVPYRDVCGRCGARRVDEQIGLEESPAAYVERLVAVFREVRRVLRRDGVVFLNLGDSYAGSTVGYRPGFVPGEGGDQDGARNRNGAPPVPGLKPKDLVGVPWRVAFALQDDGWWLRSDVVWSKPNPMPESVTDRPTRSHEYVFVLARSERYMWDADAIREPAQDWPRGGPGVGIKTTEHYGAENGGNGGLSALAQRYKWSRGGEPTGDGARHLAHHAEGRNARSVWTIATQPTPEAHFATFPEALVERCVKAGSRERDMILDPFVGSGTTCRVARRLGRHAIGIDLSAEYLAIAARRLQQLSLLGGVS